MNIFVAGGSGTIGVPLVRALAGAGHTVTALTRSPEKVGAIRAIGAAAAVADALDADALRRVVVEARPTHVIHQLTALPKQGIVRASQLRPTNRLRSEGTRNLLAAAIDAGARRFVGGSFALLVASRPNLPRDVREGAEALESMESQILDATRAGRIEGVVLRYGLFYGPGTPTTERLVRLVRRRLVPVIRGDRGLLPCIHIDDAVSATVAALDRAQAGGVYDIVDDQAVSMSDIVAEIARQSGSRAPLAVPPWIPKLLSPYMAGLLALQLPLSNAKARADLQWRPAYPTWREGVSQTLRAA
jgi:nucleoside-diphosphate-sugar epimerase